MIEFAKAHACGNDFLMVDREQVKGRDLAALARELCARTTGIGADGVEFLSRANDHEARVLLHNADGSVAEISGNGTRCVAAWLAHLAGLGVGDEIRVETDAGLRICRVEGVSGTAYRMATGMGVPLVARRIVRLNAGVEVAGVVVSMGNPHFVVLVDDASFQVAGQQWQAMGAAICPHPDFPAQTNVEFVHGTAADAIEIRIFERGVGPTSSSGTGSSASAAAMIALHGAPSRLRVQAPGGEQSVEWAGDTAELHLSGPAVVLASGAWLAGGPQ